MIALVYYGICVAWAAGTFWLAVHTKNAAWMAFACCGPLLFVAASKWDERIRASWSPVQIVMACFGLGALIVFGLLAYLFKGYHA